jgi:hypothetical protein
MDTGSDVRIFSACGEEKPLRILGRRIEGTAGYVSPDGALLSSQAYQQARLRERAARQREE